MGRVRSWTVNRRIALPVTAGAAVVLALGGLYGTALAVGGDIDQGTRVLGVDLGGMSRAEARRALTRELGPAAAAPIAVKIGDRVEKADPAAFGFSSTPRRPSTAPYGPATARAPSSAASSPRAATTWRP